jgi:hypothetical protein
MEQQQAQFDESTTYTTGNGDIPPTNDYFPVAQGQKLSPLEHLTSPTAGQRLLLAIVSLVLLFLTILLVVLLAVYSPHALQDFGVAFGYLALGLFVAVIVLNVQFNRKR